MKHTTQVILLAALLANGHYLFAADSTAAAAETAAKPPPHPGEPAAHQALIAGAPSNPARIYAREHPAEPPRVEPVYLKPSRTDHWEITLPKLHPNGADAILTLAVRDGAVVSGYTLAPSVDNFFHYTSTYRLELAGDRLTGSVRIRFLSKDQLNASEFMPGGDERVGILDVRSASGKLNGQMEWLGGAAPQKTAVTGSVFTGGRPSLPRDAVAGGELWPGHRGALGSGAAVDQGHVLVSDMSLARPVWKVAEDLPDGRAHQSGAGSMGTIMGDRSCVDWLRHSGAKSGPVVADGCVYLYTMIPSGVMSDQTGMPVKYALSEFDRAVVSQAAHDWLPGKPASPPAADASAKPRVYPQRTMFCVGADDAVFCFDARTGATLWKTVYPCASANYGGSKGGPHLTPFVANGRIYVLGATERVYCLDAKTGKEIWQSHTGWSATGKYKVLQDCLATRQSFPVNRSLETALVVADGVVVLSDNRGKLYQKDGYPYTEGPGLIGLDAATGKRLWQTPEATGNGVTPCRWKHQDRTYILTDGGGKTRVTDAKTGKFVDVETPGGRRLRLLDPKTGQFLWEIPCGPSGMCLVVDENHVVCNTGTDKEGEISCFRITPAKAEKLWSLPKEYSMPWGGYFYPVIHRGHLYFSIGGKEGSLVCVRLADGKVIVNLPDLGGGHTGGGAFLIAGEGRTFSQGICVTGIEERMQPVKGQPWRVPFAIGYLTPLDPALADGRLFIRDKTGLVCYDLREGAK